MSARLLAPCLIVLLSAACSDGVMNAESRDDATPTTTATPPDGVDMTADSPGQPPARPPTVEPPGGGAADMGPRPADAGRQDMVSADEDDGGVGGGRDAGTPSEACAQPSAWCDDFESGALDGARYREVNFGASAVRLSQERAHSGSWSVRVDGDNFTQMLAVDVPAPRFYVRLYLNSDTPMNMGHNTYINATEGDGDPNQGEAIRVGEHRSQLEINRKSDDREILSSGDYNSLEGATQFEPDRWYCLEVLFDGPGSRVKVWVDGQAVDKLEADWTAAYATFKFGYEKYHGPAKTLWYDDLALAETRIGCL